MITAAELANRTETKTLIARQIAIAEGKVWDRLPQKARAGYLTTATNILATVERKMKEWKW